MAILTKAMASDVQKLMDVSKGEAELPSDTGRTPSSCPGVLSDSVKPIRMRQRRSIS